MRQRLHFENKALCFLRHAIVRSTHNEATLVAKLGTKEQVFEKEPT